MSTDAAEIKALLMARVEDLARTLAPDGHRAGRYWMARNPVRDDRHAGSFWVALRAPCAWKDEATGDGGDLYGLIAYVHGFAEFRDTIRWAKGWLGVDGVAAPEIRRRAVEASAARAADEANAAELAEQKRRAAHALYLSSRRLPFLTSPADAYLQGRGIDVARLDRIPGCLGWLPDGRHTESGTTWPIMVAAFTRADGKIGAVHRTWLAPTNHPGGRLAEGVSPGSTKSAAWQKAPVVPVRKIWPSFKGATIRLWRGASGLSVDKANADALRHGTRETLVLVEGVEDGLSVVMAAPELRVWCAGSLGNLAEIALPPCCDRVVVCADNDWGKPQAEKQLDAALAALAAQGVEVAVARSPIGKDVNDCLRGHG